MLALKIMIACKISLLNFRLNVGPQAQPVGSLADTAGFQALSFGSQVLHDSSLAQNPVFQSNC